MGKSRIDKKSGHRENRQKAKNRHGEGQNSGKEFGGREERQEGQKEDGEVEGQAVASLSGENKDVIDLIYEQVKDKEGNIIILEEIQKVRCFVRAALLCVFGEGPDGEEEEENEEEEEE